MAKLIKRSLWASTSAYFGLPAPISERMILPRLNAIVAACFVLVEIPWVLSPILTVVVANDTLERSIGFQICCVDANRIAFEQAFSPLARSGSIRARNRKIGMYCSASHSPRRCGRTWQTTRAIAGSFRHGELRNTRLVECSRLSISTPRKLECRPRHTRSGIKRSRGLLGTRGWPTPSCS